MWVTVRVTTGVLLAEMVTVGLGVEVPTTTPPAPLPPGPPPFVKVGMGVGVGCCAVVVGVLRTVGVGETQGAGELVGVIVVEGEAVEDGVAMLVKVTVGDLVPAPAPPAPAGVVLGKAVEEGEAVPPLPAPPTPPPPTPHAEEGEEDTLPVPQALSVPPLLAEGEAVGVEVYVALPPVGPALPLPHATPRALPVACPSPPMDPLGVALWLTEGVSEVVEEAESVAEAVEVGDFVAPAGREGVPPTTSAPSAWVRVGAAMVTLPAFTPPPFSNQSGLGVAVWVLEWLGVEVVVREGEAVGVFVARADTVPSPGPALARGPSRPATPAEGVAHRR